MYVNFSPHEVKDEKRPWILRAREDSVQIGSKTTSVDSQALPETLIYISCGWESFKEVLPHLKWMWYNAMESDYILLWLYFFPLLLSSLIILKFKLTILLAKFASFSNRIASYYCLVRHGIWKKPMDIISFLALRGIDLFSHSILSCPPNSKSVLYGYVILNVTLCYLFWFQIEIKFYKTHVLPLQS